MVAVTFLALLVTTGAMLSLVLPESIAAEKVRFAVAFKWAPPYVLVNQAIQKNNIWKNQGLQVEWIGFRGGADMHRAISARAIDVGLSNVTGTIFAVAGGVPELMIARWESAPNYSIWVLSNSPLRKPRDIKGGKIGVFRMKSTSWALAVMALTSVGLSEKDVKFIGVGGQPARVAALKSGAIDGSLNAYDANASLLARGEVRALVNIGGHLPKPWIEGTYVAHRDFIAKKPEVVMKTVRGVFQAIDFIRANRAWAAEMLVAKSRFTPAGAKLAVDEKVLFPQLGQKISRRTLQNVMNFMVEYKLIKKERLPAVDSLLYPSEFVHP